MHASIVESAKALPKFTHRDQNWTSSTHSPGWNATVNLEDRKARVGFSESNLVAPRLAQTPE